MKYIDTAALRAMDKIDMLFDNGSVSRRPKQGFRFDKVATKFCEYAKRNGRKHRKSFVINNAPVAQLDRASGYEPRLLHLSR